MMHKLSFGSFSTIKLGIIWPLSKLEKVIPFEAALLRELHMDDEPFESDFMEWSTSKLT